MEADDDASAYLEAAGFDFEPPPDYEAPEPSTAALRELLASCSPSPTTSRANFKIWSEKQIVSTVNLSLHCYSLNISSTVSTVSLGIELSPLFQR